MARGTTTQRGYGYAHQQLRATLLPHAYGSPCTRCGQTMRPGQTLDLDHTDDRGGYRGFAHRSCNRSAGAAKGNARRKNTGQGSRRW